MLTVSGLGVNFGRVQALRGVDLTVEEGTVHGVIGPNGAGKSTLIDVVSGRRRPSSGRIYVEGRDITKESVTKRKRSGISRSFQRTSIFPTATVRDQLELAAALGDSDVEGVAESLGLSDLLDKVAGTIAYGDQRRVDIALSLLGKTKLLLLDEPGAGLSSAETKALFIHVRELIESSGTTAVIVEHDVDAIFSSCDRVTVLNLGSVLADGPPDEVRSNPDVIAAYLGSAG